MARRSNAKYYGDRVTGSTEVIKLTKHDRKVFINALLNPPKPNKNLKAAAKKYFELVRN